ALCERRARRAAEKRRDRPRRRHSRGAGGRRGSRVRRQALPNHRAGCFADHPADARQAQYMTPVRVLAVASEVYPIVKTGGLADVARALPLALNAHGVEMRTLMPGYPDVMRMLGGAGEIRRWPDYFGGPGRLLAG